ncbi:hypothetical protein [Holdemania sp. Marseille-P2844]|uniref:hypothetical protein n=1 Tax=Holdemania sp. Marseille-P2844 TaxID=1852366 RepID=UPI000934501A|nr:hypothetical protein [Holdemania sp. Marseille-P2844]
MLKEAIEKIQELVESRNKVQTIDIEGTTYTELALSPIKERIPRCDRMDFCNLEMLIENIKTELDDHNLPLRVLVKEREVNVYSSYDRYKDREHIFRSTAQAPNIEFNQYMSVEAMIIMLQTNFAESENRNNLIQLISRISSENKIEMTDDGMGQRVAVTQGVSVKGTIAVPPLVKLIPFRTFYEVVQPEQMFLFRIDKNMNVALFDADGGAWKASCQLEIKKYLIDYLYAEIEDRKVIVG